MKVAGHATREAWPRGRDELNSVQWYQRT